MGKLRSLLKLKPILKKYKLLLVCSVFSVMICSLIAIPIPYITGKIVDTVLIKSKSLRQLYIFIFCLAILYIMKYICSIISNYISVKFSNQLSNELKLNLLKQIVKLPMSYLGNIGKGYLQGRISECNMITVNISNTFVGAFINTLDIILSILTMILINAKLSIIVLVIMPLFFVTIKITNKSFTKTTEESLEATANMNAESFEIINGVEDIKILNGKNTFVKKFEHTINKLIKISLRQKVKMVILSQNISAINDFGTLLVLLISGILILKGEFTIGLYTTFSLYVGKIFSGTQFLANVGPSLKQTCLSIERVYEFIEMEDEDTGKINDLNESIRCIKFENVSFRYKNDENFVFKSLGFEIRANEKILIRGVNGAGKSTLVKIIDGLYEPQDGTVTINNLDLCTIRRESLRKRVGIVSQNIYLFKGTVLDNILYGQERKKREDVEKLLVDFKLKKYMDKLPQGLDTTIIENRNGISGGQIQVMAFIRTMLSNKDVIILDEPIANVDEETRGIILDILKNYNFKGILIMISHYNEGLDFFDRVIDINKK